jgi:hypothetical protein
MKHPDNAVIEVYDDWYEFLLEQFVEDLQAVGFAVLYRTVRGNAKDTGPCIFFDEHNVVFDADVDWDIFFLNDKTFAENYPAFFMLVSSNPSYHKARIRRTGNRYLGFDCDLDEYDINCEYHGGDLVADGFFKGVSIDDVSETIGADIVRVPEYILDVAKSMASDFKRQLDDEYEHAYEFELEQYTERYNEWLKEEDDGKL